MLHPWPRDVAAQERALAERCYPLTGHVFEFLDALGSETPVWLGFLANGPVTPENKKTRLNGRRHMRAEEERLDPEAFDAWYAGEYTRQVAALRNFGAALIEHDRSQHVVADVAALERAVREFARRRLAQGPVVTRNPYRGLGVYGVHLIAEQPGAARAARFPPIRRAAAGGDGAELDHSAPRR